MPVEDLFISTDVSRGSGDAVNDTCYCTACVLAQPFTDETKSVHASYGFPGHFCDCAQKDPIRGGRIT